MSSTQFLSKILKHYFFCCNSVCYLWNSFDEKRTLALRRTQ